jgi:predicted regulator of Ras-like GTPase activity (Roadblock/LC7/MglB family)
LNKEKLQVSDVKLTSTAPVKEDLDFINLNSTLTEIRKIQGVIGYILKNKTSATADLNENSKIVDYALLTSQAIDFSGLIAELFSMGTVENMTIEGKTLKILCLTVHGSQVCVLMEKNADYTQVLDKVLAGKVLNEKEF